MDCAICVQEGEHHPPCTRTSVLYENFCLPCNPGAGGKKEPHDVCTDPPSVYVGESSRSIKERAGEHWKSYRRRELDSHILKHQVLHHDSQEPKKFMRTVGFYKSALARQCSEAVRIRRRGGEGGVLNSKSEFNRSHIPRLVLEVQEDQDVLEEEERRRQEAKFQEDDTRWEQSKMKERSKEHAVFMKEKSNQNNSTNKRESDRERKGRAGKKRKYVRLEEDWGEVMASSLCNVELSWLSEPYLME